MFVFAPRFRSLSGVITLVVLFCMMTPLQPALAQRGQPCKITVHFYSKTRVAFNNYCGATMHLDMGYGKKLLVPPDYSVHTGRFSRRKYRKHTIRFEYSDAAFQHDVNIIQARIRKQYNDRLFLAVVGSFLDEYFFEGELLDSNELIDWVGGRDSGISRSVVESIGQDLIEDALIDMGETRSEKSSISSLITLLRGLSQQPDARSEALLRASLQARRFRRAGAQSIFFGDVKGLENLKATTDLVTLRGSVDAMFLNTRIAEEQYEHWKGTESGAVPFSVRATMRVFSQPTIFVAGSYSQVGSLRLQDEEERTGNFDPTFSADYWGLGIGYEGKRLYVELGMLTGNEDVSLAGQDNEGFNLSLDSSRFKVYFESGLMLFDGPVRMHGIFRGYGLRANLADEGLNNRILLPETVLSLGIGASFGI